jgi:hypothetical protein
MIGLAIKPTYCGRINVRDRHSLTLSFALYRPVELLSRSWIVRQQHTGCPQPRSTNPMHGRPSPWCPEVRF